MKKLLIAAALVGVGSLCLQDITSGHGGTYRGPGDTVPPGGGGGGGGAGAPGAPAPGAPAPSAPGAPAPSSPGAPAGGPAGPKQPMSSGGLDTGPDLTVWQYWWGFNKEPYINLKAAIHSGTVVTGSDEFFLGQGETEQSRDSMAPSQAVIRGRIVPALKKALESERSNDILDGSLIALAKIGDEMEENGAEPMSDAIKPFLSDSSQQLSETAAVSLGILANDSEDNVNILLHMLRNESAPLRSDYNVQITGSVPTRSRAFAAYGLGLIGYSARDEVRTSIVEAMAGILDGEGKTMGTRDIPVACLISIGLTPLPFDSTAEALDLSEGWPKPEAIASLTDQVMFLMNFYEDSQANNFMVRAHVPMAVARLIDKTPGDSWLRSAVATRFLEDVKKRSDAAREIQQSCIQALGVIGDCDEDEVDVDIRAALMAAADGEVADQQARNFALIAIGQVAGRPGSGKGDSIAGLKAGRKDNPRSFLITKLAQAKSGTRPWAALGLAVMERSLADKQVETSADVRAALRASLEDAKSPVEVGGYAVACGIVQDEQAAEILSAKLEKLSDDEARGYCAVGLGLINDRGAIEQITEVISKSKYKPDLLKSAAIGLGLLGDKEIVTTLIEMLGDASALSAQAALSSALGFIGDTRSVDPLIAMLEDKSKTDLARGFAAVALGIVADKEPLPWNTKISVNINYRANTTTLTSPEAGTGILDLL